MVLGTVALGGGDGNVSPGGHAAGESGFLDLRVKGIRALGSE